MKKGAGGPKKKEFFGFTLRKSVTKLPLRFG